MAEQDTSPGVLARLRVIAAAVVLFLALGEAATRLLNWQGHSYDLEMFKYSRALKRDAPPEAAAMHHWHVPGASARLQGVEVAINPKGLRDFDYDYQRRPGTTRILILGDSITLGWGVRMEDTYPKVLERSLNAGATSERKYEVINGGVGNYTTSRIVGLYQHELHRYAPDLVVFSFFINNANDAPDSAWKAVFDTPLQFPVFLWSRFQRVASRYRLAQGFDEYYAELYRDDNPLYQAFRERLSGFLAGLRKDGKQVVVVSLPDVFHLQEPRYRYQFVTDKVFAIARAQGASNLDLFPAVQGMAPGDIMNTPEDRHPNAEGHRRFAVALQAHLKTLGVGKESEP